MSGKSNKAHLAQSLAYLAVHLGPFCDYGMFLTVQSNGMEGSIKKIRQHRQSRITIYSFQLVHF